MPHGSGGADSRRSRLGSTAGEVVGSPELGRAAAASDRVQIEAVGGALRLGPSKGGFEGVSRHDVREVDEGSPERGARDAVQRREVMGPKGAGSMAVQVRLAAGVGAGRDL